MPRACNDDGGSHAPASGPPPGGRLEVLAVSGARRWRWVVWMALGVSAGLGTVLLWTHQGGPVHQASEMDRGAWERQVKAQEARVEAARVEMLDVAEGAHMIDLALWNRLATDKNPPLSSGGVREKAVEAIHNLRWQLEILQRHEGDELLRTAARMADMEPSPMEGLWPTYQDYQRSLAQLKKAGLGPGHPSVREVEGQLTKMKERMAAAVESIKETLRTQLEMGRQALELADSLQGRSSELTEGLERQMKDYHKFVEAKENYERQKKRLAFLNERDSKEME